MMDRDHYVAELREAERLSYRALCRVRCLEANLDRIAPEDFEPLMASLEAAQQEATDAVCWPERTDPKEKGTVHQGYPAYREGCRRAALYGVACAAS